MANLEIRTLGDPVLRRVADEITDFGDSLKKFADDMIETLLSSDDGIGLAAPQVGASRKFVIIALPEDGDMNNRVPTPLVNPEIFEESEEVEDMEEGCLSLPGLVVEVERSIWIKFRYQNLEGKEIIAEASDYLARVIQHELDHLDGVLIHDHMPALKCSLIRSRLKRMEKEGAAKAKKLNGAR